MVETLKAKISRVVITDLKDTTFFANIYVDGGHGAVPVDARPSDSIAIALRSRVPIFVVDQVFEKSSQTRRSRPLRRNPPRKRRRSCAAISRK
jgi:bifunctional DNase/RNase